MDPRNLEKVDFLPKLSLWVKNSFLTNSRVLILNMTNSFWNSSPRFKNQTFLLPSLRIFNFGPNFSIRQNRRHRFRVWQYCFQIPGEICPNQAILLVNLGIFILLQNFVIQNSTALISYVIILFSIFSPKIPKLSIFGRKFKDFHFWIKLCNQTNSKALISNTTSAFLKFLSKAPKWVNFGPRFNDFHFCTKLCFQNI